MNTFGQNMKAAIVTDLAALVTAGVLNSYIVDNGSKKTLADYDYPGFPCAVVSAVNIPSSEYADQATNLRQYEWFIAVVTTPDNIPASNTSYTEYLIDSVLNQFDLDVTLQGMANGGVSAAQLGPPGPIVNGTVTYAVFFVKIVAKQLVPAGVQ